MTTKPRGGGVKGLAVQPLKKTLFCGFLRPLRIKNITALKILAPVFAIGNNMKKVFKTFLSFFLMAQALNQ